VTRKIAILTGNEVYRFEDFDSEVIAESITEWSEVSEEEYQYLAKNLYTLNTAHKRYYLVEHLPISHVKVELLRTIEQARKRLEKAAAEEEARKEKARQKKAELAAKKKQLEDKKLEDVVRANEKRIREMLSGKG
jgi:MoxR-like ATPase